MYIRLTIIERECIRAGEIAVDMLAVSIMMKIIKIKTLLEVLLRDASG